MQSGGKVVIQPVGKALKALVDKNTEAKKTLERLRALYFAKSEKYHVPVREGEPVLEVALEAMNALFEVAEANS